MSLKRRSILPNFFSKSILVTIGHFSSINNIFLLYFINFFVTFIFLSFNISWHWIEHFLIFYHRIQMVCIYLPIWKKLKLGQIRMFFVFLIFLMHWSFLFLKSSICINSAIFLSRLIIYNFILFLFMKTFF